MQTADRILSTRRCRRTFGSPLAFLLPSSSLLLLFTILMSSTPYPRSQHTEISLAIILACLVPAIAFASWFILRTARLAGCGTRKRKPVDLESVHPYPFAVHKSISRPNQAHPIEHRRETQPVLRSPLTCLLDKEAESREATLPPPLSRKASSSWHGTEDMQSPALSVWRTQFLEADWWNLAEEIIGPHPDALPLSDRKPLSVTRFPMLQPHVKVGLVPKIHIQPSPPARKKYSSPNERRRPLMFTAFNGALKWELRFRMIQSKKATLTSQRHSRRQGKENNAV